jgi:hypothetical protein
VLILVIMNRDDANGMYSFDIVNNAKTEKVCTDDP